MAKKKNNYGQYLLDFNKELSKLMALSGPKSPLLLKALFTLSSINHGKYIQNLLFLDVPKSKQYTVENVGWTFISNRI